MRYPAHGRATRLPLLVAVSLAVAAALVAIFLPAGAAPPPKPAPNGVAEAQAQARNAARQVAALEKKLRLAAHRVARANQVAAAAEARFEAQLIRQRAARAAATQAAARARVTQRIYAQRHADYVRLVVAIYENGGGSTSMDTLLTAQDPAIMLDAAQDEQLLADQEATIVAHAQAAADANNAAQARKAATLAAARRATAALAVIRDRAARALRRARSDVQALQRGLAAARVTQSRADAVLSQFLGGWALADPARAGALNQQYLEQARQQAAQPPAARAGHWNAAMAGTVIVRALLRIGTPYAWDGGAASGPTRGVCAGGGAENDCHVVGFDCSGLALYAWAPYLALPHSAAAQYTAAGRVHPSPAALRPGDLVFWSGNGTVGGIHHVAIYVGDGNVVQAPQSGDIVRVTPLASVDAGYFGATRPLS